MLHIAPEEALMAQIPDLVRSRALPEMPVALRPIFQVVDLHQVSAADMVAWLTNAYGAKVKVFPADKTAAVMVFGLPENVRAAIEAIHILDQARLAGRQSLRVGLVYWTATAFAAKLVDVLRAGDTTPASSPRRRQPGLDGRDRARQSDNTIIALPPLKILATSAMDRRSRSGQPGRPAAQHLHLVQNTTASASGRSFGRALGQQRTGPVTGAAGTLRGRRVPPRSASTVGIRRRRTRHHRRRAAATRRPPWALGDQAGAGDQPQRARPANRQYRRRGQPPASSSTRRATLVFIGAQRLQRIRPLLETLDRAPREAVE